MAGDGSGTSTIEAVASGFYIGLTIADLLVVADVLAGGALHRWAGRQLSAAYHAIVDPVRDEQEIRRQAAWVVWEAMLIAEEGASR